MDRTTSKLIDILDRRLADMPKRTAFVAIRMLLIRLERDDYQHLYDLRTDARSALVNIMATGNLVATWRDVAHCLGVSHIAIDRLLECPAFSKEIGTPSILVAAYAMGAEAFGGRTSIPAMSAVHSSMSKMFWNHPPTRYRAQAKMRELFGDAIPKPEPVRNFIVVKNESK